MLARQVAQAVVQGVEVVPVVVGEGEGLAERGQELAAGLVVPAVDVAEPPAGVLDRVRYLLAGNAACQR